MKKIDFLPLEYRKRNSSHQVQGWWVLVAVLFAGLILSAAGVQNYQRIALRHEIREIETVFYASLAKQQQLTQVRQQLDEARQQAALFNFLKQPWPKSQLLAEIIQPLPETIQFTELTMLPASEAGAVTSSFSSEAVTTASVTPENPWVVDFLHLQQLSGGKALSIQLRGTTTKLEDLHRFVAALTKAKVFSSVQLKTVEASTDASEPNLNNFELRILVGPGYGQPGGPEISPPESQVALRETTASSAAEGSAP